MVEVVDCMRMAPGRH